MTRELLLFLAMRAARPTMRELLALWSESLSPPRVSYDREGRSPYLSRWYLIGHRRESDEERRFVDALAPDGVREHALPFNLFLHRFHRSDDDGALHSHPFEWAVSWVLVGGYSEERRVGDRVVRRDVLPWRINFIRGDTFHRVDLFEQDAWSLFLVGPKLPTWHFWDRHTRMRARWNEFIAWRRGMLADPGWESDVRESWRKAVYAAAG